MKRTILFSILFLLGTIAFSQSTLTSQKAKRIDSLLTYLSQQNRFMGAVCIRQKGTTVFNKAYGIIGEKNGKPVPADVFTKYRIASISKSYTATMIMQLLEEKKLSLDDKLAKYFKGMPNGDKITIQQMLSHQSGLYDYVNDPQREKPTSFVPKEDWLKLIANQKSAFEPGTKSEYSNTNYMLLSYIIEQVTGQSFNDNLQSRICKKAGLTKTLLPEGSTDVNKNEALSYWRSNGKWEAEQEEHVSASTGCGGIITTAEEVNKFYEALFQNKLVKASTLKQMLPVKGENKITDINAYGYGLESMPFYKHTSYGHSGHIDNFMSMASYDPDEKASLSILDNGTMYPINDVAIGVLSILHDKPYSFPDFTTVQLMPEDLKGLAGVYAAEGIPMKIKIMAHGDKLWVQPTGQDSVAFTALGRDKFEFSEAILTFNFTRDEHDIAKTLTTKQGQSEDVFTREETSTTAKKPVEVDEKVLSGYEGIYSASNFPIKITIRRDGQHLTAQATGQGAFVLDAVSDKEFKFDGAGIAIAFKNDATGKTNGMILTQGERFELNKESGLTN